MKQIALILVVIFILPIAVLANSGGPPNGRTGAPGEGTCRDCHSSYPINSGDGVFTINAPSEFEAGLTYPITVEISDPGQQRWGFEITPESFGSITITDPTHTQQSSWGGKIYAKQTSAGTYNGTPNGPVSWSFDWTAPAEPPEQVTFYAAGIAANANNNTSGDYVYTISFTSNLMQNIPTLSEWGMIILALLLLAGGTVAIVRREDDLMAENA